MDNGAEFCLGSERKEAEWNTHFDLLNAGVYSYNPHFDVRKNLIERTHLSDDQEYFVPRAFAMHDEKSFLDEASYYNYHWNALRPHSGIEMNGCTPLDKLKSCGIVAADRILLFPTLILENHIGWIRQVTDLIRFQKDFLSVDHTSTEALLGLRMDYKNSIYAQNVLTQYQIFNVEENVENKKDGTLVTKIDRATENFARRAFFAAFPGIGFCGEEFDETESQNEYRIILDPVDGTNALISNDPRVGINLAVQKHSELVTAIVANTATGQVCYAQGNEPTRLIQLPQLLISAAARVLPDPRDKLLGKTRVLTRFRGNDSFMEKTLFRLWNEKKNNHVVSPAGSAALNFIDAAKGLYTYVHEWVTPSKTHDLTGKKLVDNAGGKVIDLDGNLIELAGHEGVFIAGVNEKEIEMLREIMNNERIEE